MEARVQPRCAALPNWRFTLGKGYRSRAVTGPSGALSIVTTPFSRELVTQVSTPFLDTQGRPTGADIDGATTFTLSDAEAALAAKPSSLWVQGGTTTDPVLDQPFPGQYGFGALRCAIDNLNGDNVEWISVPRPRVTAWRRG